jgi:hypothetical protein
VWFLVEKKKLEGTLSLNEETLKTTSRSDSPKKKKKHQKENKT